MSLSFNVTDAFQQTQQVKVNVILHIISQDEIKEAQTAVMHKFPPAGLFPVSSHLLRPPPSSELLWSTWPSAGFSSPDPSCSLQQFPGEKTDSGMVYAQFQGRFTSHHGHECHISFMFWIININLTLMHVIGIYCEFVFGDVRTLKYVSAI